MAMLLSIPIGSTLLIVFVNSIRKFPGLGLPEILKNHTPNWIRIPFMIYFLSIWFVAGMITVISFSEITKKYINPDISSMVIAFAFICIIGLIARLRSDTILYSMEILIIMNVPFVLWVLYKAVTNNSMNYDACMEIVSHIWNVPTWDTFAAGTYIFTGYTNLVIFNRLMGTAKKMPFLWTIPIVGSCVLATSFLIPVGFHGTMNVNAYIYPWISTSDSMRVEFGLVERVLFIFMYLYTNISLAGSFIHWHVCLEFVKELMPRIKDKSYFSWIVIGVMGLTTYLFSYLFNDQTLYQTGVYFLNIRFASEIALVVTMFMLARRKKQ